MTRKSTKTGKCSIKVQRKILAQIEGINLPKIGTRAKIKRNGQFKTIGEVVEVIGSTRNPWIVISASKTSFDMVQLDENVFLEEQSEQPRGKKRKTDKKKKRKRS